ncbi:transposase [Rhizobium leguminosarum]|uniref:transposase n=1 Tax=Rhizobium leguminosarum TaxID=384 RepID=UPI0039656C50
MHGLIWGGPAEVFPRTFRPRRVADPRHSARDSAKGEPERPPSCDFKVYKDRNRIERMFNRLKQFRRIATRYDKTRTSFEAFLSLAAAKIWLPHFTEGL